MAEQKPTPEFPVWRLFKTVGDVTWDMRAPLLVSLLSFIVFYVPGQIQEIYRVLSLELDTAPYRPIISLLALAILSYFLWALSRAMWKSSAAAGDEARQGIGVRFVSHMFSLIIALLPIVAVLSAMMPASFSDTWQLIQEVGVPSISDKERVGGQFAVVSQDILTGLRGQEGFPSYISEIVESYNRASVFQLWGLQAVAALGAFMLVVLLWRSLRPTSHFIRSPFSGWYFWPILLGIAALISLIAAQPVLSLFDGGSLIVTSVLTSIGTFTIICFFLLSLAYLFAASTRVYDRIGIPVITLLLTCALVFAFFDWNNNHRIQLETYKEDPETRPKDLYEAFLDWYGQRPEARTRLYRDNPAASTYPVYIVAAQGGGIYASNLAALTLARLYTACPALRHHIFAVSAVSGGSLGASVFNAFWERARAAGDAEVTGEHCQLQAPTGERVSGLERDIRTYLSHDFLSPVLAGALFPDFVQRFVVPGFGALDRARAFEASLNHAWVNTLGDRSRDLVNPFSSNFLRFSERLGAPDISGPMLVMNTTSVELGQRYVIAPLLTDPTLPIALVYPIMAPAENGEPVQHDLTLATAIGLSARFPVILPPGGYPLQLTEFEFLQKNLVDGGYFESSAIETAIDLVNGIRRRLPQDLEIQPEFRIIILNEDYSEQLEPQALTEFGAPVMTLDKTRRRRGQLAKLRVKTGSEFARFYSIELQHDYFYMPLGWHLSHTTQTMIGEQIGYPSECKLPGYTPDSDTAAIYGPIPSFRTFLTLVNKLNNNRCSLADIIAELNPPAVRAEAP